MCSSPVEQLVEAQREWSSILHHGTKHLNGKNDELHYQREKKKEKTVYWCIH